MKINSIICFFCIVTFSVFCSCNTETQKPVGTAKIDGIDDGGYRYDVTIWQRPDPDRGSVVTTLSPNTSIEIMNVRMNAHTIGVVAFTLV